MRRGTHRLPAAGWAVLAVAATAAWQGTQSRQSTAAQWCVLAAIAAVIAAALGAGRGRQRRRVAAGLAAPVAAVGRAARGRTPAPALAAGAAWVVVVAATVGWDLYSFARQRHDLPTLSRLCGDVTHVAAGRGLLFAAWLALGAVLALGWRATPGPPPGREPTT